jgi:N-acetylmuramic acid 6-phosphate etherase
MVRLGKTYENLMVDLRATNAKLKDRAARIVAAITQLSRDESLALLDRAGWDVKAAIVMQRRGIDRAAADALLARVDRRLRAALESESPS